MKIKSSFPKEVLNELKWCGYDLSKVEIYFINRGSPDGFNTVKGNKILRIEGAFVILTSIPFETWIPFHRIRKITYDNQTVFER